MSIVTLRGAAPVGHKPVWTGNSDLGFERRWAAWTARGLAHDHVVRQRLIALAILTGASALAAILVYGVLAV